MFQVQKVGSLPFASIDAAEAFYEQKEAEGFAHVSMLTNTPSPGEFTVTWGHHIETDETADEWEMRKLGQIFAARESEAEQRFTADCAQYGRQAAAMQLAAAVGYEGRHAEMFIAGFVGASAKHVNPRAEGLEKVFREGRAAWGSNDGQRLVRIESVKARSILVKQAPKPFSPP